MKLVNRSFGFEHAGILIQGDVFISENNLPNIAGFFGDKEFINLEELANISQWPKEKYINFVDRVTTLLNTGKLKNEEYDEK